MENNLYLPIKNYKEVIKKDKYRKYVPEYMNDYSICLDNSTKKTLFQFPMPINNKEIDISYPIYATDKFTISSINNGASITFANTSKVSINKSKDYVIYDHAINNSNIKSYQTESGIGFEINGELSNAYEFIVDFSNNNVFIDHNSYIVFNNTKGEKIAILQTPILKNIAGEELMPLRYELSNQTNNSIKVRLNLNSDFQTQNVCLMFCFDFYYEKIIYDSAVSQNKWNENLSNICMISNNSENISNLLIRFDLKGLYWLSNKNMERIIYAVKVLNLSNNELRMFFCIEDWCSWTVNWDSKPKIKDDYITGVVDKYGYINFDITDYVKLCLANKNSTDERYGFMLTAKEESASPIYLATADNSIYPPYISITFS